MNPFPNGFPHSGVPSYFGQPNGHNNVSLDQLPNQQFAVQQHYTTQQAHQQAQMYQQRRPTTLRNQPHQQIPMNTVPTQAQMTVNPYMSQQQMHPGMIPLNQLLVKQQENQNMNQNMFNEILRQLFMGSLSGSANQIPMMGQQCSPAFPMQFAQNGGASTSFHQQQGQITDPRFFMQQGSSNNFLPNQQSFLSTFANRVQAPQVQPGLPQMQTGMNYGQLQLGRQMLPPPGISNERLPPNFFSDPTRTSQQSHHHQQHQNVQNPRLEHMVQRLTCEPATYVGVVQPPQPLDILNFHQLQQAQQYRPIDGSLSQMEQMSNIRADLLNHSSSTVSTHQEAEVPIQYQPAAPEPIEEETEQVEDNTVTVKEEPVDPEFDSHGSKPLSQDMQPGPLKTQPKLEPNTEMDDFQPQENLQTDQESIENSTSTMASAMSDSVALEQCIPHRSPSSENHAFEMAQPFLGEASVKEENLPVKIMVELPRQEQERMPRVDFHQEVPQFPSSSSLGDAPQAGITSQSASRDPDDLEEGDLHQTEESDEEEEEDSFDSYSEDFEMTTSLDRTEARGQKRLRNHWTVVPGIDILKGKEPNKSVWSKYCTTCLWHRRIKLKKDHDGGRVKSCPLKRCLDQCCRGRQGRIPNLKCQIEIFEDYMRDQSNREEEKDDEKEIPTKRRSIDIGSLGRLLPCQIPTDPRRASASEIESARLSSPLEPLSTVDPRQSSTLMSINNNTYPSRESTPGLRVGTTIDVIDSGHAASRVFSLPTLPAVTEVVEAIHNLYMGGIPQQSLPTPWAPQLSSALTQEQHPVFVGNNLSEYEQFLRLKTIPPANDPVTLRSSYQQPDRVPAKTCAKCKNHGKTVLFTGHSPNCPYKHCPCRLCVKKEQQRGVAREYQRERKLRERQERENQWRMVMQLPV